MKENFEEDVITLTDEDGNESKFYIIGDMEVDGEVYYALEPVENDEDEYVILKATTDANGNEVLLTIEDDDEFDRVADAFEDSFMNEYDLDEAFDEDEPEEDGEYE